MPKEIAVTQEIAGIWNPLKAGEKLAGFYNGSEKLPNSKFEDVTHTIGNGNGKIVMVNDYAVLSRALSNIPEGAFVHIVYDGEKKGEKYNYKNFVVRAWELEPEEREEWIETKVDFGSCNMKQKEQQPEESGIDPDTQSDSEKDDDLPF